MDCKQFFNSIADKRIALCGIGISNTPLILKFLNLGARVFACDRRDREAIGEIADRLEQAGAELRLGEDYLKNLEVDVIFRTPGMNFNLPELDNIAPEDFVVVELSSFQLISMRKSPDVAVITNVAPNHLDVHKDMDEYIGAKKNIMLHQNAFSRTVLNLDDEITKGFTRDVRGQLLYSSMTERIKNGSWIDGEGNIFMSYRGINAPIMNKKDISLMGEHNVANYLSAISAVWGYVGAEEIRKVAKEFTGVQHRIEFVRELNGVRYYNDSIASSPTRTIAGLKSFEGNVILLAGGYDKHIPFEPMVPYIIDKVKLLILTGPTADKIEAAVKKDAKYMGYNPSIIRASNLSEAVELAHKNAVSGDVVTLSPACASFDAFPNFAVRGDKFKELVNAL